MHLAAHEACKAHVLGDEKDLSMRLLFVLILFIVWHGNGRAQSLEFKGVPFGSDSETVRERLYESIQNWYCNEYPDQSSAVSDKACAMGNSTYATRPIKELVALFFDGKVGAFLAKIDPNDYGSIRDTVIEKYGKPKETRSTVRNQAGGQFDQRTATWVLPGGTITLDRYADRTDEGRLAVRSIEYLRESSRRIQAKPPAKKDI